jgi:hypothetical protein
VNARVGRVGPVAALLGLLLVVSAIPSSQAHSRLGWSTDVDLGSTAIAYEEASQVTDTAYDEGWRPHRRVQAETTATATVDCDGCSGTATSLQILYLNRPSSAMLENVSTAWTSCVGCSTASVSVQVVVVRSVRELAANNRALAVSAECDGCRTASLAFQLVVVDRNADRLSSDARRELKAFVAEQAALAGMAPVSGRLRSAAPAEPLAELNSLEALVNTDLGSRTLEADVDESNS